MPENEQRSKLSATYSKIWEDYDKLVIALSGGALGISITFFEKFIGSKKAADISDLLLAWNCWTVSLATILLSYLSSIGAYWYLFKDYETRIKSKRPGGYFDLIRSIMGLLAGFFLILGIVFMHNFANANIKETNAMPKSGTIKSPGPIIPGPQKPPK